MFCILDFEFWILDLFFSVEGDAQGVLLRGGEGEGGGYAGVGGDGGAELKLAAVGEPPAEGDDDDGALALAALPVEQGVVRGEGADGGWLLL